MWYLISMPSPGASLISRESILYRFGCLMKGPLTVGASPSFGEGFKTGTIVAAFAASTGGSAGAAAAGLAGWEAGTAFSVAFASSINPSALPVPRGSIPYSAGRTATTRITAATAAAITVAAAIFAIDGA